jgi:hypothetical protein
LLRGWIYRLWCISMLKIKGACMCSPRTTPPLMKTKAAKDTKRAM